MKLSTPQQPKPIQHKSILLIGPPGGGKTTLAMQFPGLLVLDCDRNLDGPEAFLRTKRKMTNLSYAYEPIGLDDNDQPVPVEKCYDRLMVKLNEAAKLPDIQTVAIDSLTMVNEFIIRKLINAQNRTEMEARDWIPFKSHFYNLLVAKLRMLGKHTICTVHESIVWKGDPKNIMVKYVDKYEPSVQGSIVDFFGAFFTDMWRCESAPGPGMTTIFKLTTERTSLSDLKNSCCMPKEIIDPTFEKVNAYLKL